jgi:hypothetical protein
MMDASSRIRLLSVERNLKTRCFNCDPIKLGWRADKSSYMDGRPFGSGGWVERLQL